MSHADYLQDCWNQANPDEDERTDEEIEACHTVDERTHEVVSVYCSSDRVLIVAGDQLLHLTWCYKNTTERFGVRASPF